MIDIQSNDPSMQETLRVAESAAQSKASILIQGEEGTGKTVLAKQIHQKSPRSAMPCVTVNCSQQPEMLLETELFGFEKGAFAGTVSEKRGKFEQANGGTLILDNVNALSPKLQQKILRVLESGAVERIGAKVGVSVDVRIVAISSENLVECVTRGAFSESLMYRLNQATIVLPALKDRLNDMKAIVANLMGRIATRTHKRVSAITEEAIQKLQTHTFPGNIRELEGILERGMVRASDGVIRPADLIVGDIAQTSHQGTGAHSVDWEAEAQWAPGRTLHDIERAVILKSLAFHNGNRTHTARELGISIRTLRNKLNEYRKAGISV